MTSKWEDWVKIIAVVGPIVGGIWAGYTHFFPAQTPEASKETLAAPGNTGVVIQGNNNAVTLPQTPAQPAKAEPEALIARMTTGLSRRSVEAMFGTPQFDDAIPEVRGRNLVFVFPRFFLQVILSPDEAVVFYSVTTRSPDFRPQVPILGQQLLATKFAGFGPAEHVDSHMTSKYYTYLEKIYLGNAGNYRTVYLGFCPSGAPPEWKTFEPAVLDQHGAQAVQQFRIRQSPNCYGVGEINGDETALLEAVGVGLDYHVSKDLP